MSDQAKAKAMVPGGVAGLILGITGCCLGWAYGIPGIICSAIGLGISGKAKRALAANPSAYKGGKLASSGFTWSLVGLIESIIMTIVYAIVVIVGIAASANSFY
ncbi:MAG: hypothetical protein JXD23_06670 [Spirochaetales bacterium]|nr:hypothetical protein [Spirochaetales bacterium]